MPILRATTDKNGDGSEDEYFNFEPEDSELAKLGEELNDIKSEAVIEEDETLPTPKSVAFEDSPNDDEEDEELPAEEDDEIEFDSDVDEEEYEDEYVEGEEEDEIVAEEVDADEGEEYDDDDWDEDDEEPDAQDIADGKRWEEIYGEEIYTTEEERDVELLNDEDPNYMIQKEMVEKNMAKVKVQLEEKAEREKNWYDFAAVLNTDSDNHEEDTEFIENFNPEAVEKGEETYEPTWSDDVTTKIETMMDPNNDDYVTVQPENIELMENGLQDENGVDQLEAANEEIDKELEDAVHERQTFGQAIDEISELISTKFDKDTPRSKLMDIDHVSQIGMSGPDAFDHIPNATMKEINDCLLEMGSASYNATKWLVYDIDFNVTNLMLAATKHSPKAPIIYEHWLPQLQCYDRYQYARDQNFDFTWDDVENADMEELELYYRGFGYFEIPKKKPQETGIIDAEELDDEEMRMAGLANWVQEVYNPDWDRLDFDDDRIRNKDNVFSPEFVMPRHPDLPTFDDAQEDVRNWKGEMEAVTNGTMTEEQESYQDKVGKETEYEVIYDEEFDREFRGHLIVACTDEESDLVIAEKITLQIKEELGKKVYVETRILSDALMEDNVFEIWLESYDIELLHSKRRASVGYKDWEGKLVCDDEEIERLVKRVAHLVSDDSRYSYRMDMDCILT